jgi:hypothetical protein
MEGNAFVSVQVFLISFKYLYQFGYLKLLI